jgi:hypothetical protein
MQIGRENDIDSFASRVSALRRLVHSAGTSSPEIESLLANLKEDVQAFLRTLQSPL